MLLLQLFINGLQLGAIYALTAVGFSLIFGSTKIFHVAHGSAFTIAGYLYWWSVAPFHGIVFGGMARNITGAAERSAAARALS